MRRRTFLTIAAGLGVVTGLAGCGTALRTDTTTPPDPSTTTVPTNWTATVDCDPMHADLIKVKWVREDLADDYTPIPFSDLSAGEREILRIVVTKGGYATCQPSAAFRRFVERVARHRREQPQSLVHLYYDGAYYGLYVEQDDQVFSSN